MTPRDEAAAIATLWRALRSDVPGDTLTAFRSSGRLSVGPAIGVYKNAYWIRQHRVLRDLFPLVLGALGEVRFRELVRRYLLAHPSSHPELEHLGADLPRYLRAERDRDLVELAATAELEQGRVVAALAPDAAIASLADIRPATFGASVLTFVPSLRVIRLDATALRLLARELEVIGAAAAIVARRGFVVTTYLASHAELGLLTLARSGATIDQLLAVHADDHTALHRPLSRWFERGWIARIEVRP